MKWEIIKFMFKVGGANEKIVLLQQSNKRGDPRGSAVGSSLAAANGKAATLMPAASLAPPAHRLPALVHQEFSCFVFKCAARCLEQTLPWWDPLPILPLAQPLLLSHILRAIITVH